MTQEKFDPNIIGEKIIKTIKTIFDPDQSHLITSINPIIGMA